MKKIVLTLVLAIVTWTLGGCSVYMAARQPDKKDVSVLGSGTARAKVIAELGTPVKTCYENGDLSDTFVFRQGYAKGTRWARGVLHTTADVLTIGLWEMVATPIELIADGDEVHLDVRYDSDERVKAVEVLKGVDAVKETGWVSPSDYATRKANLVADELPNLEPIQIAKSEPLASDAHLAPTVGIVFSNAPDVISPDIRTQWLSKTTGVGDWLTEMKTAHGQYSQKRDSIAAACGPAELFCSGAISLTAESLAPFVGAYAVAAYAIYLPFATVTGAVGGEIDAQTWRLCREDFLEKVRAVNPAKAISDAVLQSVPSAIALPQDDALEAASRLGLLRLITVKTKAVGLKTCDTLGRFSLILEIEVTGHNVATREEVFTETFSSGSPACMKVDAFCGTSDPRFTQDELVRMATPSAHRLQIMAENMPDLWNR